MPTDAIVTGSTDRSHGSWALDRLPDRVDDLRRLVPGAQRVVWLEQVHEQEVLPVGPADEGNLGPGDALVTDQPGTVLTVRTADCVPVFFRAPQAVALAHAGMAGSLAGIAQDTVRMLSERYGVRPEELEVTLGPHICGDCYKMSDRNRRLLRHYPIAEALLVKKDGDHLFSMGDLLATQLRQAGVERVGATDICTVEHPDYFSARGGDGENRQLSYIMRAPTDA